MVEASGKKELNMDRAHVNIHGGTHGFHADREPKKLVSAKLKCGYPDCVARCQKIPLCATVLRKQSGCVLKIDQEEIAIGYYPK